MSPEHAEADDVVDLVDLLFDHLLPALQAYQLEVGRRCGLEPVELVCVDEARRCSPVPLSVVGRMTGRTRSAVTKLVRRLEAGGHVERIAVEGRKEVSIRFRPHPERDAEHARLRAVLTARLADALETNRVVGPERRDAAATWTAVAARTLGHRAQQLGWEREDEQRAQERRRLWAELGIGW